MIIIRLKGGMGNQMFQYALGRNLAARLDCPMKLDLSALLDRSKKDFVHRDYDLHIFNTEENFLVAPGLLRSLYKVKSAKVTRWTKKQVIGARKHWIEPHFHVVPEVLEQPSCDTVYEGWWQSAQYFTGVADQIRQDFTFKKTLLPAAAPILNQIERTNSICLNVRRTDFLKVDTLNTTNKAYFLMAVDYLAERIENPNFFIFSDDMAWCEQNLQLGHDTVFVPHSLKGEKFGNYHRLMRACKHFIIPNSSFAWWAVWLNEHPDKMVIAPKNWFNDPNIDTSDLVPADWIRL